MSTTPAPHTPTERVEIVGRYALHGEIASGGMAVVHFGRLLGPVGFSRPVAIKRLHPQLARDPELRAMFVDEARLASRIRHPNVVPTLDVVSQGDDLLLVMEYVHGEALNRLMRAARATAQPIPLPIVLAVMTSVLHGLHAAHEATSEAGEPLHIVHRDVSPQNVMVGVDGAARVLDFGIARAAVRVENTREGIVKGKIAYMAPEQLGGGSLDRRADVFAAAVVLWEMVAGRRLFIREDGGQVLVEKLLRGPVEPPSAHARGVPKLLDAITLHGLARSPEQRFATAREMALALEKVGPIALLHEVGDWVQAVAADSVGERAARLKELETTSTTWRASLDGSSPSVCLAGLFDDVDDDESDADPDNSIDDDSIDVAFEPALPSPSVARSSSTATTRVYRGAMSLTATPQVAIVPLPETRSARAPHALLVFVVYAFLGAAIVLATRNAHLLREGSRPHADAPAPAVSTIVTVPSFSIPRACPSGMPAVSGEPARLAAPDAGRRDCQVSTANEPR
jgi:serine/threonine protein kinase